MAFRKGVPNPHGFQKGRSGNPGGRPKVVAEIRELARRHTPTAFRRLIIEIDEGDTSTARIAAAKEILDRAWGKAVQAVDIKGNITLQQLILASMQPEALEPPTIDQELPKVVHRHDGGPCGAGELP